MRKPHRSTKHTIFLQHCNSDVPGWSLGPRSWLRAAHAYQSVYIFFLKAISEQQCWSRNLNYLSGQQEEDSCSSAKSIWASSKHYQWWGEGSTTQTEKGGFAHLSNSNQVSWCWTKRSYSTEQAFSKITEGESHSNLLSRIHLCKYNSPQTLAQHIL